jgi:hypothetical protein
MQMKTACQLPRARQALSGSEVVTEDAQNDLSYQLFANTDFASPRKPELHGRPSYSQPHICA